LSLILLLNLIHADLDLKLFAGRDSVRREALRLTGITVATRWDENAGLRRDAIRSQVIDALEAQEIKETGNEKD
jgi:hypothetical protein